MITKPTCLLLGAGASAHLQYPFGNKFRDEVLGAAKPLSLQIAMDPNKTLDGRSVSIDSDSFVKTLGFGGWSSPDEFLEEHTEFLEVGKFLIARVLCKLENPDRLMTSSSGWYDVLRKSLIAGADDLDSFRQNKLSIVTFNYDRSLDHFLHGLVQYRYSLDAAQAWEVLTQTIPIIHLHGTLGEYPEIPYGPGEKDLWKISEAIQIVHEVGKGFLPDEFVKAKKLLTDSERIRILGFGFHKDNVRRLDFFSPETISERDVVCICGPQTPHSKKGRDEWVAQWGFTPKHFADYPCSYIGGHAGNPFE